MINNRQNGRRRGRGSGAPRPNGGGNGADRGSRLDNRARGNASQLHEKYKTLARDTQMQGDRVMTEYYLQFADHYFRVLSESRSRFEEQRRDRFDEQDDDGEEMDGDFDGIDQPFDSQADNGRQRTFDRPERNERPREQQREDRGYRDDRQPRETRERDGNREAGNRDNVSRDNGNRENAGRDAGSRDSGNRDTANRDGRERETRDPRPPREPREIRMNEPQRGDFAPESQDQPREAASSELREQAPRRPREGAGEAPVAERRPRGRPRREPIPAVASDEGERIDIGVLPPSFTAAPVVPVADVQPDAAPLETTEEKPRRRLRRPRADEATVDA